VSSFEFDLGLLLGESLYKKHWPKFSGHDVCVVCDSENADGLSAGVIEHLTDKLGEDRVHLWCLWSSPSDIDIDRNGLVIPDPVYKHYKETHNERKTVYIVVKNVMTSKDAMNSCKLILRISSGFRPKIILSSVASLSGKMEEVYKNLPPIFKSTLYDHSMYNDSKKTKRKSEMSLEEAAAWEQDHQQSPEIVKARRTEKFGLINSAYLPNRC
jgi:hypothetical protein